jgi:hypothetical protein
MKSKGFKMQVQTPEGGWFYVKQRPEGLTYSIYSTDALNETHFERLVKEYPNLKFRVITK